MKIASTVSEALKPLQESFLVHVLESRPVEDLRALIRKSLSDAHIPVSNSGAVLIQELFDRSTLWKRLQAEVECFARMDEVKFETLLMMTQVLASGGYDELIPIIDCGVQPIPFHLRQLLQGKKHLPIFSCTNPSSVLETLQELPVKKLILRFGIELHFRYQIPNLPEALRILANGNFQFIEHIVFHSLDAWAMTQHLVHLFSQIKKGCQRLKRVEFVGFRDTTVKDLKELNNFYEVSSS